MQLTIQYILSLILLNLMATLNLEDRRISTLLAISTGANVNIQFKMVDNPRLQLTVRARSTRSWTPIAMRTRARMKK